MTDFSRSLKKEIAGDILPQPFKTNPLLVLGFSPILLDLGLSDDELHEILRRFARSILAKFHPDQNSAKNLSPHAIERQRQYSEIFNQLDNKETFLLALQGLKDRRSEQRSDTNQVIQGLKDKIEAHQLDQETVQQARLEQARAIRERDLIEEKSSLTFDWRRLLPGFSVKTNALPPIRRIEIAKSIFVISISYNPERTGPLGQYVASIKRRFPLVPSLGQVYQMATEPKKDEAMRLRQNFMETLRGSHLGAISIAELIDRAVRSGHRFPIIDWDESHGFSRYGFKNTDLFKTRLEPPVFSLMPLPDFLKYSGQPEKEKLVARLSERYIQCLKQIARLLLGQWKFVSKLQIRPEIVNLSSGSILEKDLNETESDRAEIVMGSVLFTDIDIRDIHHLQMERVRAIAKGLPFLIEGQPLMTSSYIRRIASDLHSPKDIKAFLMMPSKRSTPIILKYVLLHVIE